MLSWEQHHPQPASPSVARFVEHLTSNAANSIELILCLIRGSDQLKHTHPSKPQPISDLTLRAFNAGAPAPTEQNYLSLATFAMFRLVIDNGLKAGMRQQELDNQLSTIVQQVPAVMLHRAMDVQYNQWLAKNKDAEPVASTTTASAARDNQTVEVHAISIQDAETVTAVTESSSQVVVPASQATESPENSSGQGEHSNAEIGEQASEIKAKA